MKIMHDVDMKEYTSFRAGGRADVMAVPSSVQELQEILQDVHEKQEEYLLLGNGSNTIFRDEGYHGVVIHLGEAFSGIEVEATCVHGLAACMAKLTPRYRQIILLKYYHGFSCKEIAKQLDITEANAIKLDQRAKNKLLQICREEGIL